jgi:hypothetical protein
MNRAVDKLYVSVATFSVGEPLDLRLELALTKAAVLYADHVTLIGPKVVMLSYVDRLTRGSRRDRDVISMQMLGELPDGAHLLRQLDDLAANYARVGGMLRAVVLAFALAWLRMAIPRAARPLERETMYSEFKIAARAGVLTLDPLTKDGQPPHIEEVADQMAGTIAAAMRTAAVAGESPEAQSRILETFQERLLALLSPGSPSEPLFDQNLRPILEGLAYFAERTGLSVVRPSSETAIANALIGTVPTFPDAPMGEILSARRALQSSLARFRSAIVSFSREVTKLPGDATFEREVGELYRRDVAPALEELKAIESDLRLDHELMRHGLKATNEVRTGVLALAALRHFDVDAIVSALVAAAPAAGKIGGGILEDHRTQGIARRQNRFLFLHELKGRLR